MRVALIDPSLFTLPYDAALADALNDNGHQTTIFGRPLRRHESVIGKSPLYPHFYLRSETVNEKTRRVIKGFEHILGMHTLPKVLTGENFAIAHFQWCPLPIIDEWMVPRIRKTMPIILTVHDITPFNDSPGSGVQKVRALNILKIFDRLIVHSHSSKRTLMQQGLPSRTISVIPHGILEIYNEVVTATKSESRATIMMFGRIKPYKGIDVLLNAFALLPKQIKQRCCIKIVGEPHMDMSDLLQQTDRLNLTKNVEWQLGYLPEESIGDVLRTADIFVFPYRAIDASGVLMSCIPYGKPVIASRLGAFEQLIQDGKTGLLVDPGDAMGLSRALSRVLTEDGLDAKLGQAIRGLQHTIPSWSEIAVMTTNLYDELLCAPET